MTSPSANDDADEIDLDDVEEDEEESSKREELNPAGEAEEAPPPVVEEPEEETAAPPPKTKAEALKQRLRKLKLKMNQARQLNQQAVKQEAERISHDGMARERKRIVAMDRKAKEAEYKTRNAKALDTAARAGVDGKVLTEQASDSLRKETARAEKQEANRFSVNDYYNPEGQHRNYQRSLTSLPQRSEAASTATYNPLQEAADSEQERRGAQRLANELHRRIEKSRKREDKKRKKEEDEGDISYINQRNKRFNEKINRTYDKHTAEIRQNLERGTAL